jgi:hypothetical protein
MLSFLVPVLFTFYRQGVLKNLKNSGAKRLTLSLLMSYVYGAPSKARNLTSYIYIYMDEIFTGYFASWTVHFFNICVKKQQIYQLYFQVINYVWWLLHVSALYCHHQGAFLVLSERCSIEQLSESTRNTPWGWQGNAETCRSYHTQ